MSNWTTDDVPPQAGRVAVVTGANTGLGFATAETLAARGATVVLAVRDTERGRQAAARIEGEVSVQRLDLSSLESVHSAASQIRADHPQIDLLINNAGVMYTSHQHTADGFELQFGTNHLGHFAFTGLLLDRLLPVEGSRVVTVASTAHRIRADIHFDDLQWERSYSRVGAYGQSKLANLMFAYELQRRLTAAHSGTISTAAHPGVSSTELARNTPPVIRATLGVVSRLVSQSASEGALPTLRAATDPAVLGAQYYGPDRLNESRGRPRLVVSSPASYDVATQQRLWAISEELTGVEFPV